MPYKIKKAGNKFQVVKAEGGKVMGTHPSRTKARAQLRALYANEAGKSGAMKQAMSRDEVMALLQELHDITMELGATCGAMAGEGEPEEEFAETPEEEATEPVEGEGEQGSPEVGTEEYAAGTSAPEQARTSREEMNAQYQEQQARVNESEPGTEPRPGFSRNQKVGKSVSLDDESQKIRSAWMAQFNPTGSSNIVGWIENVLDDGVAVSGPNGLLLYPYTINPDGSVVFDTPKKVKREFSPANGSKSVDMTINLETMLSVNYIKSLHIPQAEQLFRDVIAVKSIGQDTVKGYLALWGDPDTVDVESEFFTGTKSSIGATDFWDKALALPRPLTWDHAQDGATKQIAQVGALVELGDDDIGRWYVAQLDRSHRYRKAIDRLVSQRAIGTSSDSAPQYVIRQPVSKGATWLKQWPLFAAALTTTPCEPRQIGSVDYFKSLGIDLGELAGGTEAAQNEQARRAELEKRVQSLQRKERLLKLYV